MGNRSPCVAASGRGSWASVSLGLALALLTVLGCAGTQRHQYQTLKSAWERAERGAGAPDRTDDALSNLRELERQPLIQLVLERNPTIRAARYSWRAALARYPQVTSLDDPTLGLGAAPRSFGSSSVDDAPKFDLSQKLPFPELLSLSAVLLYLKLLR